MRPRSGRGGRRFKSCHSDQPSLSELRLGEPFGSTKFWGRAGAYGGRWSISSIADNRNWARRRQSVGLRRVLNGPDGRGDFCSDLLRHRLHLIRGVILSIATCSRISDACLRDSAKACNVVAVSEPIKAEDSFRRLESDRHAGLDDGGGKVASNGVVHRSTLGFSLEHDLFGSCSRQ
jgi:hypothetical protein